MLFTKSFHALIHLSSIANKKLITKGLSTILSYILNCSKEYNISQISNI